MRMPTLGEFILQATKLHGATLHQSNVTLTGPDGRTTKPRYLTRGHNGQTLHVVLPDMDESEVLTPTLLRSLADRLAIETGLYPRMRLTENGFEYDDPPKAPH